LGVFHLELTLFGIEEIRKRELFRFDQPRPNLN